MPFRGFENINDLLIPLVWFEESALIPEESARKFRSLYTDRVRLINIVLSTLFLAALGLLAINVRLMASNKSYCFNQKSSADESSNSNSMKDRAESPKSSQLDLDEDDQYKRRPLNLPLLQSNKSQTQLDQFQADQQSKSVELAVHYNDTLSMDKLNSSQLVARRQRARNQPPNSPARNNSSSTNDSSNTSTTITLD